jgi:hypothetical protein
MFRKNAIIIFLVGFLFYGYNVFANDENPDEISNSHAESRNTGRQFTFQVSPALLGIDFSTLMFFPYMDIMSIAMDLETQYKISDTYNVSFTVSFWINNDRFSNDFRIDLKQCLFFVPLKRD